MGSQTDAPIFTKCSAPVCEHAKCEILKQHGLCQHWFFLRWVSSDFTTPKDLVRSLHQRTGDMSFRFCGAVTREGVYEGILRFDKARFPARVTELLPPALPNKFHHHRSVAWGLECCLDTVQPEAEFWHFRLQDRVGELVFGDRDLPQDFLTEVKAAKRATHGLVPLPPATL